MTTPEREIRYTLLDCRAFIERERDGWIDTTSIYITDEGDPVRATKADVDAEDWETIDEIEAADALIARIKGTADAIEAALLAAKAEEREACQQAQPATAGDPNESAYQRGYFDGVMAYARAIRARGAPAAVTKP